MNSNIPNSNMYINFPIPYEDLYRRPPNTPDSGGGPFPQGGKNPGDFNQGPPPKYIPNKKSPEVQSLHSNKGGKDSKFVPQDSIKFCLFKYTYIWEIRGRSYWTFLTNVDRQSISGFRWFGRYWGYFGLSLKAIDSFFCHTRFDCEECNEDRDLIQDSTYLLPTKKEYSSREIRDVYSQTLVQLNTPEIFNELPIRASDNWDYDELYTEIPYTKSRDITYKINLEVTYPNRYEDSLKKQINALVNECSNEVYPLISLNRTRGYSTPLEEYNESINAIPKTFRAFERSFKDKLGSLENSNDLLSEVNFCIRQEKHYNDFRISKYNY